MPNLEVSEADREAALARWIRHFQSPRLQPVTVRHNVPERLSQIEKEVFSKTSTAKEYNQYWNDRVQKIMQRIHAQNPNAAVMQQHQQQQQQQQQPPPSQPMQQEQLQMSHRQQGASPYGHMSPVTPSYQHQYEPGSHGGAAGVHASAYAHHGTARYSTMGAQGNQVPSLGDATGYYPGMMYPTNQRSNMPDVMPGRHMPPPGGYRMNDSQYTNGGYGMMPAPGDARQRHSAVMASNQQQRVSAPGVAPDSRYASMRQAQLQQQQQHPGAHSMPSPEQSQHGSYNSSPAGGDMAGTGANKRMPGPIPGYSTPGPRPGMQHQMDMSMQPQMQQPYAPHVQHPTQTSMMPQTISTAQGAAGMSPQGRDSTANNSAARSGRESFAGGLTFEPTPIDQIGLAADDDDFSDLADMLGGKTPTGSDAGAEMPQGHSPEQNGMQYASNVQRVPSGGPNGQVQLTNQPWNTSMELMPQSVSASPYTSPAVMQHQQRQHPQQQQSIQVQHAQVSHSMAAHSAASQPHNQAQWMTEQPAHSQRMHTAQKMHMQQQSHMHSQQAFHPGQQGYPQANQHHSAEQHHALARAQRQQQDSAQVGQKQARVPTTQPLEHQAKKQKLQPDTMAQQQPQQPGGGMSADSKMKVTQDALREYRKAGEQVQIAHQLLRVVSGQAQQGSLSPQAIAHLGQAKWADAVKKAIGDYHHTERTLHHAVHVLKTQNDRVSKEQAMHQLHRVATHARVLQETLRQHIASAEAARARFATGGAIQDPTAGGLLTPRSSNSVQGVAPPTFDGGQQGSTLTPRAQPAGSAAAASGDADPSAAPAPAAEGPYRQRPPTATGGAPPTPLPKAKLRIRARASSAMGAASQAPTQAADTKAAAPRASTDPGMPTSAPPATQQGFQGSSSGVPSPNGTPPLHMTASAAALANPSVVPSSQPTCGPPSQFSAGDPKAMHMHMHGSGQHKMPHMMHNSGGLGAGYGGQPGVGSPDNAPSALSSGTHHRGADNSMQVAGQYNTAAHYNNSGHHGYSAHASLAGGGGDGGNAPAGLHHNGTTHMQPPMTSSPLPGGDMATAAAPGPGAAMYAIPSAGISKAQYDPEGDYLSSGNLMRLSMVSDGAQKAMLSTTLNPVTHPIPPTSGIQASSFDSDTTEVLSGPLRTPAPTTLSVCDLDLSVNDRYSTFSRAVDPATPMVHLPGREAYAASDASARPPAPPLTLPLPDTEAAHRLSNLCSSLTAEFPVSLHPAKCNPVYSQEDAYTVAVHPSPQSPDSCDQGPHSHSTPADKSWCFIEVLLDEKAWDVENEQCMIVWPQVDNSSHSMQAQGRTAMLEMAASELRSLMEGLLSETGKAPSLRCVVNAWCKVHSHISQKLAARMQQY